VQGGKKENFYITGVSGTPVAAWFRTVLRTKQLADIAVFPVSPADLLPHSYEERALMRGSRRFPPGGQPRWVGT
jgi:hypothetical protein